MKVVADLQIHSRFSRAVSPQMVLPTISEWAKKKGINLIATGDWTHPIWSRELERDLEETSPGIFKLRDEEEDPTHFLLSTEISSVYSQNDKTRRIHTLIFAPSFNAVNEINKRLTARGANLMSDGRPITGLSAKEVAKIALAVDEKCLIIPAHAWTPWYSLYGSKSGFDSIEECFEDISPQIYAVETGLSSDPAMNWRIEELDDRRIVSFSDAHSPQKLGREATVFDLSSLTYDNIRKAIMGNKEEKIVHTIEFYPEEGKYHYTGHRACNVIYSPKEARKRGVICPVCGNPLTVGVMSRVEALADRDVKVTAKKDDYGVRWIGDEEKKRPSYAMLVPLLEIIAETLDVGVATKSVLEQYERLISFFGSEFEILLRSPVDEIGKISGAKIAEGIKKIREGNISIKPGYDGVFGTVEIWKGNEEQVEDESVDQKTLF